MDRITKVQQITSALVALIGIAAILVRLVLEPVTHMALVEAVRDLAGFLVTIGIFVMSLKIFNRMKYGDFIKRFDLFLNEWVHNNRYLIDRNPENTGESEEKYRFYFMLCKEHHNNAVTREKNAADDDFSGRHPKAAFLYTDPNLKGEIRFGLSQSFFQGVEEAQLPQIANAFVKCLKEDFGEELNVSFSTRPDGRRITVSLKEIAAEDRTEDTARRLIDMVDSMKTMILSYA